MRGLLRQVRWGAIGCLAFVGVAGALASWSRPARAQQVADTGDGVGQLEAGAEQAQVLVVRTSNEGTAIDPLAVLDAVGRELGVPVLATAVADPALGTLEVEIEAARIRLRYRAPQGRAIVRSVGTPASPPRAVETIALLAGNLVRDQASGLLAALQARLRAQQHAAVGRGAVAAGASGLSAAAGSTGRAIRGALVASGPTQPPSEVPADGQPQGDGEEVEPLEVAPANLSLVHPVAIFPDSDERFVCLEIGAAYSYVGAVYGLAVSGAVTRVARQVYGAAVHGLWGHHHGAVYGLDVAGAVNAALDSVAGVQVAGAVNATYAEVYGLQTAGVVNITQGAMYGLQAAGAVNVANGPLGGLQLAGGVNVAHELAGLQVAGGVNLAEEARGVQLAPVNVAQRVEGVQIGVINVAEHVDGVAIGLLSIADNGRVSAVAWASSHAVGNLGVQSTVGPIYTLWAIGMHPGADQVDYIVEPSFAIGGHLPIEDFFLDQDVGYSWRVRFQDGESHDQGDVFRYRAKVGWRIVDPFAIFVGGGLWVDLGSEQISTEVGPEVLGGVQVF